MLTNYKYTHEFSNAISCIWDKSIFFIKVIIIILISIYQYIYLDNFICMSYPVIVYTNLDNTKLSIIKENKDKSGIYRWIHKESGKTYIGSAIDLSKRLKNYFNLSYLNREIKVSNSFIYRAIIKHGYSNFSLEILEYCDIDLIIEREQYYLDMLKPEYNINKFAGSVMGLKHTETSIEAIRNYKLGKARTEEEKLNIAKNSPKASPVTVTEIETNIVKYFTSIRSAANYIGIHHSYLAKSIKDKSIYKGTKYVVKYNKL